LKRLPTLARIVHNIFISEQRSAIEKEVLLEKIRYSDYSSANIEADFDRLVNKTDRWLIIFNEWIKRNSKWDINKACKILKDMDS
jgi:hypothetical protein